MMYKQIKPWSWESLCRRESLAKDYPFLYNTYFGSCGFEIGDGWLSILEEVIPQIDKIMKTHGLTEADFKVTRVCEIDGELIIFEDSELTDQEIQKEIYRLIKGAKLKSRTICVECGEPAERRLDSYDEVFTMCDVCLVVKSLDEAAEQWNQKHG
jgi:hypothetical protein